MDPEQEDGAGKAPAPSRRFLLAILLILLLLSGYLVRPFLAATIFALLFGYLLQGPQRRLEKLVHSRKLAGALILLATAVAIVLPLTFVVMSLIDEAQDVAATAGSPAALRAQLLDALIRLGVPRETAEDVPQRIAQTAGGVAQAFVGRALNTAVELVAGLFVFFFLLYYVLVDGRRLMGWLRKNLPLDPRHRDRLFAMSGERVRAIMLGALAVSVIQGVVAGLGWWILGYPNPVFWGFVMTIVAVLPLIGPVVIMAPAALIAILKGDVFQGVALLVWAVAVVGLVDNFVRPYIVGRSSDVHPSIILVGTLGGIIVFGVSGFVLGPLIMGLVPPVVEAWHDAAKGDDDPDEPPLDAPEAPAPPAGP